MQFSTFLKHLFQEGTIQLPGELYPETMEHTPNLVAYQVKQCCLCFAAFSTCAAAPPWPSVG